ncbi:MAG: hypothetical protein KKD32_03670 [Proteobacteria bacterium]|nr:hypothetical protein [Pseudomonadota bacterium]MBU1586259.1 hypothetical protein [Pseudomonadota bacterium]MBU2630814.1 hypothetical protein [Pseudomonadota bacterium]
MTTQTETLVRKQFFISNENVNKLDQLSKILKGVSAAKIVRDAIDAYDPNGMYGDFEQNELIAIAHAKVKEAILKTEQTIEKVDHCLENLSERSA